jgi:hypothetical protein
MRGDARQESNLRTRFRNVCVLGQGGVSGPIDAKRRVPRQSSRQRRAAAAPCAELYRRLGACQLSVERTHNRGRGMIERRCGPGVPMGNLWPEHSTPHRGGIGTWPSPGGISCSSLFGG